MWHEVSAVSLTVRVCVRALNHLCEQKELLSLFLAALWLLNIDDSENVNAFVAAGGLEVCMDVLKAPPGPSMDHAQYTVLGMSACCTTMLPPCLLPPPLTTTSYHHRYHHNPPTHNHQASCELLPLCSTFA